MTESYNKKEDNSQAVHSDNQELGAEQEDDAVGHDGAEDQSILESREELAAKVKELQDTVSSHWDQLLRSRADLENTRRRAEKEVEKATKYALEKFASELLPVKDSLEMGMVAASSEGVELAKVVEGMQMSTKMFAGVLDKFAVKEIDPLLQKFNPDLHQAMSVQESDEHEPNTVINVFQKGYLLNDRLIRPALVVVSKTMQQKTAADGSSQDRSDDDPAGRVDEMV